MEIGKRLKEKRLEAGLSQDELAAALDVSRQTISAWENGRAVPDIASILKLSDFYGVSTDELLKGDAFRQKVVKTVTLTNRYWNILFELAVLLLPFGLLFAWWGLPTVGFVMQMAGILMLPGLWYTRYRIFGGDQKEMKRSITGWCLYIACTVLRSIAGDMILLYLLGSVLGIVGLLLIYENGIHLEKGPRYWLVIALYVGIPIYIYGSAFISFFTDLGAFSSVDPFGSEYRVEEVLYGEDTQSVVELDIWPSGGVLMIDRQWIGTFKYQKPAANQTEQGIWLLVPNDEPEEQYKLVVDESGDVILSRFVDDQLQWRWKLDSISKIWFNVETSQYTSASLMGFYYDWSGNPDQLSYMTIAGPVDVYLTCRDNSIGSLTLIEEYHHGDQVEVTEYTVQWDKNNNFSLPGQLTAEYEGVENYYIYRIETEGGMYLLRLDLD